VRSQIAISYIPLALRERAGVRVQEAQFVQARGIDRAQVTRPKGPFCKQHFRKMP